MSLFVILLILLGGLALVVLEFLAVPGTTIVGLSGLGLLIYGNYEIFQAYDDSWGYISILICSIICLGLLFYSLRAKTWKRFSLNASIDSKVNVIDEKIKVGDKGVAITRLAPVGMAEFNGERMEVYTSTSYIEAKTALEVEAIEGNKVRVKIINN